MDALLSSSESALGFLTVRQREPHGFFGGYLILNARARPLEFHCTLPVQPTRAQQILFGATLHEYVCGELIGQALLHKGVVAPRCLLTDCLPVLALRHCVDQPLLHIEGDASPMGQEDFLLPSASQSPARYSSVNRSGRTFRALSCFAQDLDALDGLAMLEGSIDWLEPFSRIVEALCEAHPKSKAA